MDKFMPKTIEELNAEFEARMEKAKQDELNAVAERAAEEILEAERMRAAHNAEEKAEARRVEERSYESALDSSISATELEPTQDDFEDSYSGEDEVPAEESVKTEPAETEPEKVEAEPVQKTENEYGEPDPHGYFGAPMTRADRVRPSRRKLRPKLSRNSTLSAPRTTPAQCFRTASSRKRTNSRAQEYSLSS